MRHHPHLLVLLLAACDGAPSSVPDGSVAGDAASSDAAAGAPYGEACGDGADDDGDGLADEDCSPRLFVGVFAPSVAVDPALIAIEAATGRPLHVLQTYHGLSALGIARTGPDLAAMFARGQVAHLNVEPTGYTPEAYAAPDAPPVADDLQAMADAIADALAAAPRGRMLLTFGAEMNGSWTTWGCLAEGQYVALHRAFHGRVTAGLATRGIDLRRVRWAYGPDARGSGNCGTAASYYPGHAYVDVLGLSAYRTGTDDVSTTVVAPMAALLADLAYPVAWQRDRFVILQTGSRAVPGDDRSAWLAELVTTLEADPRAAGLIYFDAAEWAIAEGGPGWTGLTTALTGAAVTDRGLDATFLPYFWDVGYADPGFAEVQALRDAAITTGCATAPARFCPDDELTPDAATTLLARAFPGGVPPPLDAPITEGALAAAITALGGTPPTATTAVATRRRAAVLIARGAGLTPRPL